MGESNVPSTLRHAVYASVTVRVMSDQPDFQIERPFRLTDWHALAQMDDPEAEPVKELTYEDLIAAWKFMQEATTPCVHGDSRVSCPACSL